MRKLKKQNGFTLVEMLIVVAIIAILIAVSIPMVGSALERSRVAVDQANERDAQSLAVTWYLTTNDESIRSTGLSGDKEHFRLYYWIDPANHQGMIGTTQATADYAEFWGYGASTKEPRGFGGTQAIPQGKGIQIIMDLDGKITALNWI